MRCCCHRICFFIFYIACPALSFAFPDSFPFLFESTVGEEVEFQIGPNADEFTYGASGLPYGLTLDSDTGVVSGIPILAGTFTVNFQEKSEFGNISSQAIQWDVRKEGEISKRHHLSQILEVEVGEDLSVWKAGFVSEETVSIKDLPEGIGFDVENVHFTGSFSESGIYETTVVQRRVGTLVEIKYSFIVKPATDFPKFTFEGVVPDDSGVILFNDLYFYGDRASIWRSDAELKDWILVDLPIGQFAFDIEVFRNSLLIGVEGGILRSADGENFDLISLPDIWRVSDIWSGGHGVIARAVMESNSDQHFFFSSNGEDWARIFPPTYFGNVFELNGKFFFPDRDRFHVSVDGAEWNELLVQTSFPGNDLNRCVSGDGKILTLTSEGYFYSENAVEWEFKELPGNVSWLDINFSGGRFFVFGTEGGDPYYAPQQILSSKDGLNFSALELGPEVWRVDKVSFLKDQVFIASLPVVGRLEVSVVRIAPKPFVSLPEAVVAFRGFYQPVKIEGEFDSVHAVGLPEGLTFDETNGVIFGDPIQEYSEREVAFVPVLNGQLGVVSKTQLISANIDGRPFVNDQFIFGEIGRDLYRESILAGPDVGPEDKSLNLKVEGLPVWMSYDVERNRLEGRPDKQMAGTFTIRAINSYGSESKDVPIVVPNEHAEDAIDMEHLHPFVLGDSVNIQIPMAPFITRVEIFNLPEGLEFDGQSGIIHGNPTQLGFHTLIIVPFENNIIHNPFVLGVPVSEKLGWPRFRETSYFIRQGSGFNIDLEIPENSFSDWRLTSDNLPDGLSINGLGLVGETEPGIHIFDLSLISSSDQIIESKPIILAVSPALIGVNADRYFYLNAIRGIPLTESFMIDGPVEVSGIPGLPPGLEYNPLTKQIIGVPLDTGDFLLGISLDDFDEKWFIRLRIKEYFETESPMGFYDSDEEHYVFEIQNVDSEDTSIAWLYDGEPIVSDENFMGVDSSTLRVQNLEGLDPYRFQVKLTRNGDSETFTTEYLKSERDLQRWLELSGIGSLEMDLGEHLYQSGFSNLFLYAQGVDSLNEFVRPQIYRNGDSACVRFFTDRFWKREDLSVLVYNDLFGTPISLNPEYAGEENQLMVWESSIPLVGDEDLFFNVKLKLDL